MAENHIELLYSLTEIEWKRLRQTVRMDMEDVRCSTVLSENYKKKILKVLKNIDFKLQEQNVNIIKG